MSTCLSLIFLTRANQVEADLVEQLFNSREMRLARVFAVGQLWQ